MRHNIRINGEVKEIDCKLGSGILDKHGREIFEGDKVTANGYPCTVEYKMLTWKMIPDNPGLAELLLLWAPNYDIEIVDD